MWNIHNRKLVADGWREDFSSIEQRATASLDPGDVVVTLERWCADHDALIARGARIGVRLLPDDDVNTLRGEHLQALQMLDLHFGSFAEGRGYSQARQLRQGLRFDADIRAVGDVSQDRAAFMTRCGINVLRFEARSDALRALAAFEEMTLHYQGADALTEMSNATIAHLRRLRDAA